MKILTVGLLTFALGSEVIVYGVFPQASFAACSAGVFANLFNGELRCAKDQAVGEIKKAGPHALSPSYWSTYTAINTLKERGVIRNGGTCYAVIDAAKSGGAIAASAYGVPPQAAGMIATLAGGEAKTACNAIFGTPSSEQIAVAKAAPPSSPIQDSSISQSQYEAGVKIAELQMKGKIEEARIVNETQLKLEAAKQNGETDRTKIIQSSLERMNKADNEAEIRQAELTLEGIKNTNSTNLSIAQGNNSTDLSIAQGNNSTDLSIAQGNNSTDLKIAQTQSNAGITQSAIGAGAQVITALINRPPRPKEPAQNNPPQQIATAPTDPVDTLFREWGWQKVGCSPGLVFIKGLSVDTVCVNPTSAIPAGEYFYNSSNRQLEPVAVAPSAPQINHSAAPEEKNERVEENDDTTQEEGEDQ